MINSLKSESSIVSVLLGIHLAASIISQSLVDLSLFLIFIALVLHYLKNKNNFKFTFQFSFKSIVLYFFVVLSGYYFNSTFTEFPFDQLKKFVWVLNFVILYLVIINIKINLKLFLLVASCLCLIPSVYSLYDYFSNYSYVAQLDMKRVLGLVNSATYHAHAGGLLISIIVGLHLAYKNQFTKLQNLFLYFCEALLLLSVFLTFTRGIWLALILSTALLLFFYNFKKLIKFVIAIVIIFSSLNWLNFKQFSDRVQNTKPSANTERIDLMKVNWQMFEEHPWLGIGYGENLRRNREYWDRPEWNKPADYITSHAHNQYLNVLATTGILGFLCFMTFLFRFSFTSLVNIFLAKFHRININHKKPLLFAIGWMNLEFLLSCMTDVTFEYAKIRAVVLFIWALGLAVEKLGDGVFTND